MKVHELIKKKGSTVYQVQAATTVAEAAKILLEKDIGSLLICDGDRVAGIFTKNDFVRRYLENPSGFSEKTVANSQGRPLFFTTLQADLGELFTEMVQRGIRHVPVLDGGKPVGMITPTDILLHLKEAIRYENQQLVKYIQGAG
jgi:CBS domain-containing protein